MTQYKLADILTDPSVKLSQEQRDAIEAVLQDSAEILVIADDWNDGNDEWTEHDGIQIPFKDKDTSMCSCRMIVSYRGSDSMCNLGLWNEYDQKIDNTAINWILFGPGKLECE